MDLLSALLAGPRRFAGAGFNHEGEHFTAVLELQPLVQGSALMWHYTATRDDGLHLHAESTLLSTDGQDRPCLWPVMEELPFVLPHPLVDLKAPAGAGAPLVAVFASGPVDDNTTFREQITLELATDGSLRYAHAWGLPGEAFGDRSSCRLVPAVR